MRNTWKWLKHIFREQGYLIIRRDVLEKQEAINESITKKDYRNNSFISVDLFHVNKSHFLWIPSSSINNYILEYNFKSDSRWEYTLQKAPRIPETCYRSRTFPTRGVLISVSGHWASPAVNCDVNSCSPWPGYSYYNESQTHPTRRCRWISLWLQGEMGMSAVMVGFTSYLSETCGLSMKVLRNFIISFCKSKVELLKGWMLFPLSHLYLGSTKIS